MKRSYIRRKSPRTALRRTKLAKVSKTTDAKFKKKVFELAKLRVRERDKTCKMVGVDGRPCWGHLQASHIYPEGMYRSMRYDLDNMVGACTWHHLYFWHKNPINADFWIKKHLGIAKYRELQRRSLIVRVIQRDELESRYQELLKMV